ncbi:AMP-binding protein [Paracoccus aerodenitrificans]|uniref:AMP-binding protein n=1 Tax=Paracoccus aerodenitrificans TaxID=3017781 RepID=UPI0022F03CDE|nr:AMP-binding protein [Paracoccus aerodenitrificans]WBU65629.1 AMP-binding protein [Paracoccus aerodenitrificans]
MTDTGPATTGSSGFQWDIPEFYNIGVDISDKWANQDPDRLAIIDIDRKGTAREYSFGQLQSRSSQLAHALNGLGISCRDGMGDRVGVLLPQRYETAVSHAAITKAGCISIPLFTLFGEEALLHRLRDSGASAVITNEGGVANLAGLRDRLPDLRVVLSVDGETPDALDFQAVCDAQPITYQPVRTRADDPAILIYTSGTTGNPKGALHAHRVLLGHLPGVETSHNFLPKPGDRIWSPADWAWIGGLLDVLMPALHHGVTVVARRFDKFTPEAAFALLRDYEIRNAFLPPTALKLMRQFPEARNYGLKMRSVASGGETLGSELLDWGRDVFGTTINEFYGQTECNMIVSSCSEVEPPVPGFMGRPVRGHQVAVLDPVSGETLPAGQEGAIAVRSPDPVMFLGYWNNPSATAEKFIDTKSGRWLLTGDRGTTDEDGRLRFVGRDDDVISSAGYRIGPSEIENSLIAHPAVQMAGVVGKPDPVRGAVVMAYLVLNDGYSPSDNLAQEIADHVKSNLAAYEYPRVVRFIDDMPMTTTGKIVRATLRRMAEEEAASETAQSKVTP